MALVGGQRVGPYEVLGTLGAGGMGVVYRARDTRLGREVALKVLPDGYAGDAERLHRFELEARAASTLNHPNILAVYDVGTHEGAPWIVTELLDGVTLRQRLEEGPLPLRKALEYGVHVATGLAAAHEHGIVHRDVKPDNLFLTRDGQVKILDFGLAKQLEADPADAGGTLAHSQAGAIFGTAGYMAPEQVQGRPADTRSDIFSFGAVLYELLSGRRAFDGATPVERGYAILNSDPAGFAQLGVSVPAAVDRIVRRCLEKAPDARFQSARDLSFALEALAATDSSGPALVQQPAAPRRRLAWAVLAVLVVAGAVALLGGSVRRPARPLTFTPLTFRHGWVRQARSTADGKTVVYSAAWDGEAPSVYTTISGNPESRTLLGPGYELAALAPDGTIAVLSKLKTPDQSFFFRYGTLSLVHIGGGAPREAHENVSAADFLPDGKLVVARRLPSGDATTQVEFPADVPVYKTTGSIDYLRVSPSGDQVVFIEHASTQDDSGRLILLGRDGTHRELGPFWGVLRSLTWRSDGRGVLVTGSPVLPSFSSCTFPLVAVSLSGAVQLASCLPTAARVLDAAGDRLLMASGEFSARSFVERDGGTRELTWRGITYVNALSADGEQVGLSEYRGSSDATRADLYLAGSALVRRTDGAPPIQVGYARYPVDFSPDGKSVALCDMIIARREADAGGPAIQLKPIGAGRTLTVTAESLPALPLFAVRWVRENELVYADQDYAHVWRQRVDGPPTRLFDGELWAVAPGGDEVLVKLPDGGLRVEPMDGGVGAPARAALLPEEGPAGWGGTRGFLFTTRLVEGGAQLDRLDLATGERTPWRTVTPTDRAGMFSVLARWVTPDGRTIAWSVVQQLDNLYLVDGLDLPR